MSKNRTMYMCGESCQPHGLLCVETSCSLLGGIRWGRLFSGEAKVVRGMGRGMFS
jgi:hypothetical protein